MGFIHIITAVVVGGGLGHFINAVHEYQPLDISGCGVASGGTDVDRHCRVVDLVPLVVEGAAAHLYRTHCD